MDDQGRKRRLAKWGIGHQNIYHHQLFVCCENILAHLNEYF